MLKGTKQLHLSFIARVDLLHLTMRFEFAVMGEDLQMHGITSFFKVNVIQSYKNLRLSIGFMLLNLSKALDYFFLPCKYPFLQLLFLIS